MQHHYTHTGLHRLVEQQQQQQRPLAHRHSEFCSHACDAI